MVLPLIAMGIIIFLVGMVAINFRVIMIDVVGHFIQLRLDDHEGWRYYGELLDGAGYHLEALEAFKKAVTISPNYSTAWEKMGDVLMKLGDSNGASEEYRFSNS
jgi:tetratricopeptide (TPR) repeat protein